jgi:hypothetical protein
MTPGALILAAKSLTMPSIAIRYERTDLYEDGGADPVTTVAESYGMSDVVVS